MVVAPPGASACRGDRQDVLGMAGTCPLCVEPEDSAQHSARAENLTGLTKKARDNGVLRYRLEAASLDTLGA